MPQLLPFYFLNQLTFAFVILFILIFIFSKYILPSFVNLQVIRMYITKLNKINKINNPLFLAHIFFIGFTIKFLIFYFYFFGLSETFINLSSVLPVSKLGLTLTIIQKEAIVGNLLGDAHLRINKKKWSLIWKCKITISL